MHRRATLGERRQEAALRRATAGAVPAAPARGVQDARPAAPAGARAFGRSGAGTGTGAGVEAGWSGPLLAVFILTLLLPIYFHVGDLRLSPYRIFLLVVFVPLLVRLISGAAGRLTPGDIFLGLFCAWLALALYMNHGSARIPFAGVTVAELYGGYLVGRVLVRSEADYRTVFRYITIALVVLFPIVVFEMLTGRLLINEAMAPIAETFHKAQITDVRLGLHRAQAVFEHPILYGLFCSLAVANLLYIHRDRLARSLVLSGFATGMTFTSLSSAPLLSAMLQFGMVAWGRITRNAWWTLFGLIAVGYVIVDILSNRSPIAVLIGYLTFDGHTAFMRFHIWDYGIAAVWSNPLFGIGMNDWPRPHWVPSSVDNFWLLTTMRYGVPGFILLVFGFAANLFFIMRRRLPEELKPYREGHVIAALGLFMTLATVHIWGATAVFVMFYMGAGVWLVNGAETNAEGPKAETDAATGTAMRGSAAEAVARRRAAAYPRSPAPGTDDPPRADARGRGFPRAGAREEDSPLTQARPQDRRLPYSREAAAAQTRPRTVPPRKRP